MGLGDMISGAETLTAENASTAVLPGLSADTVESMPTPSAPPVNEASIDSNVLDAAVAQAQTAFQEAAPEQAAPEVAPEEKPSRGLNERVQQVISQRNEARDELARQQLIFQQQMATMQQQIAQQNQKFQEQQLALEQRRVEMMEARAREEEEAGLSDVERARRAFLKDASERAKADVRKEVLPEVEALKAQLEEERRYRTEAQKQAERSQRYSHYTQQATSAIDTTLLSGFDQDTAKSLRDPMEELLLTMSGAYGITPQQAAPALKQMLTKYTQAEMRRVSSTAGAKVAQSQGLPSALPQGRSGVAAQAPAPTLANLRKHGFDNHIQWVARGRPALP